LFAGADTNQSANLSTGPVFSRPACGLQSLLRQCNKSLASCCPPRRQALVQRFHVEMTSSRARTHWSKSTGALVLQRLGWMLYSTADLYTCDPGAPTHVAVCEGVRKRLPKESAHRLLGILAIIGLTHYNPLEIQRFHQTPPSPSPSSPPLPSIGLGCAPLTVITRSQRQSQGNYLLSSV